MSDGAQAAVEAAFGRFIEAFNACDIEAAFAMYSEDSEFVDALARVVKGRDAIRGHFAPLLLRRLQLRVIATEFRDLGRGFSTLRWNYHLFRPEPDGEPIVIRRGVNTWVLDDAAGDWSVRFSQNTFEPEATEAR